MLIARIILFVIGGYAATGLVFAVPFAFLGVGRFDPAARGASLSFRLLILPGCAGLWPVLLVKCLSRRRAGGDL